MSLHPWCWNVLSSVSLKHHRFPRFLELPPELLRQIWTLSLLAPRALGIDFSWANIEVNLDCVFSINKPGTKTRMKQAFYPLLFACCSSRARALEPYGPPCQLGLIKDVVPEIQDLWLVRGWNPTSFTSIRMPIPFSSVVIIHSAFAPAMFLCLRDVKVRVRMAWKVSD